MTACPRCGRPARQVLVPEAAASAGPLTVRIAPVAVLTCDDGHRTTVPDAGTVLHEVDQRVASAGRRRLRSGDRCGLCEAVLVLPSRRTEKPVPVVTDRGVATATLETTLTRCPDCGVEQLPTDVAARLTAVVAAALADA